MRQFDATPLVPLSYPRLEVLTKDEIKLATAASYVAETSDPGEPVRRNGLDNYDWPYLDDDLSDWCIRMYVVWFCYLYESLYLIHKPMGSIEELLMGIPLPRDP